jgi:hypothetical protein
MVGPEGGQTTRSAHAKLEYVSIAVICHTGPELPLQPTDEEAIHADQLAGVVGPRRARITAVDDENYGRRSSLGRRSSSLVLRPLLRFVLKGAATGPSDAWPRRWRLPCVAIRWRRSGPGAAGIGRSCRSGTSTKGNGC